MTFSCLLISLVCVLALHLSIKLHSFYYRFFVRIHLFYIFSIFDSIVNAVFPISISTCLDIIITIGIFVYFFSMYTPYPIPLLIHQIFFSTRGFGFSRYAVLSTAKTFLSCFQIHYQFVFLVFFYLSGLLKQHSGLIWITGILTVFLILMKMALALPHLGWCFILLFVNRIYLTYIVLFYSYII